MQFGALLLMLCKNISRFAHRTRVIGRFSVLQGNGDFAFAEVPTAGTVVFTAGFGDVDRSGLFFRSRLCRFSVCSCAGSAAGRRTGSRAAAAVCRRCGLLCYLGSGSLRGRLCVWRSRFFGWRRSRSRRGCGRRRLRNGG